MIPHLEKLSDQEIYDRLKSAGLLEPQKWWTERGVVRYITQIFGVLGVTKFFVEFPNIYSYWGSCRHYEDQSVVIQINALAMVAGNITGFEHLLQDTILHEIAHACRTAQLDSGNQHGPRWKSLVSKFGYHNKDYRTIPFEVIHRLPYYMLVEDKDENIVWWCFRDCPQARKYEREAKEKNYKIIKNA